MGTYLGETQPVAKIGPTGPREWVHHVIALLDTARCQVDHEQAVRATIVQAASVHEQTLTVREVEVPTLVAGGNSNRRIARALTISKETVKSHVKNIIEKLAAHDRTHAVTLSLRRGILQL